MKTSAFFVLAVLVIATWSCAPVFSDLQSARLAGKGNLEAAPHFTSASFSADNETDHVQNHYGLQLAYGLSDRFDIRARYEFIKVDDDDDFGDLKANVFGIGPKASLIKDRLAAYIPVGFAFGGDVEGIEEFEVQPTLLLTLPVGEYIEINPSAKGIIGDDFYVAFNVGLGLSSDFNKWAIRPEYGMLFNPGEEGHFSQFSIGLMLKLNKNLSK
jgi:hypothetical protein